MGVSTTRRINLSMWILIYSFSDTYYVWAACGIHARRIATSSGNLWKRILGSFFLFLAWILHSKTTQCGILLQIYREHGNRATILRHHPREPCAPIKMATAGSSNSSWRPLLRGQKETSKAREHFCVRKIYFWRLKEHFGRYFLKEWRFPLRKSKIGFLNPKESGNGFCVSLLNRSIQDLSDPGASKKPNNPLWARIIPSLWYTMIREILDWSV